MKSSDVVVPRFIRWFALLFLCGAMIHNFGQRIEASSAAGFAATGKIVFSSTRDGNYEIYIMNADGSQQTNLTNNPEADDDPSWSPDGKKIVYSTWVTDNWELFVMNPDGTDKTRITYTPESEYRAQWSPDGTQFAYQTDRNGTYDIYLMNVDGTGVTRITSHLRTDANATWSPDGNRLAFQSDRDGQQDVFVTGFGLVGQWNITESFVGQYQVPQWSPDGSSIAASRFLIVGELALLSPNGTLLGIIPNTLGGNSPSWAPDSSALAFHAEVDGYGDIFSVNVDGTGRTNLTNTPGVHDFRPAWQSIPANTVPVADAGGPYSTDEGGAVVLDARLSTDAEDSSTLTFDWDLDGNGTFESPGQIVNFSAAGFDGPAALSIALRATDPDGASSTDTTTIEVKNVGPSAHFGVSGEPLSEGRLGTLSFDNTFDPSVADSIAGFTFSFDCTNDGVFEVNDATEPNFQCSFPDNGHITSLGVIRDKDGGTTIYTAETSVSNVAPTLSLIDAPLDPNLVNATISASATFTDPGSLDTHTAVWDWGDGNTSNGVVSESNGSGSVTGTYAYVTPGIYTITLTVTDKDDGVGTSIFQFVVIYDPSGGFVTGGGWINSPPGAYTPDPELTGKANFGFVAKYKKGKTIPDGNTEFQFKAGDLNFKSTAYDWLVVAGAKAMFKGVGTINGAGEYGLMLIAVDGQVNGGGGTDKFRIKIWDKVTGAIIYDNQMGATDDTQPNTVLGGGSIVVHK